MDQFGIDRLHHRGFVVRRVTAVLAKHLLRDIRGQNPPIDHQRVHLVLQRNLLGHALDHSHLRPVAVENDDVLEPVVHQSNHHGPHVIAKRLLRNIKAAGVRREDVGNAVRDVRSDQRVHVGGDSIRDSHGNGIIRAIVDEAMRFERTHSEDHRLDFCGHELLELHPVQVVHRTGRHLLRGGEGGKAKQRSEQNDCVVSNAHGSSSCNSQLASANSDWGEMLGTWAAARRSFSCFKSPTITSFKRFSTPWTWPSYTPMYSSCATVGLPE